MIISWVCLSGMAIIAARIYLRIAEHLFNCRIAETTAMLFALSNATVAWS
jgi:hypothetical protein